MMLKEKYKDLLDLGVKLQVKNGDVQEAGGKLHVKGTAAYQYDKDQLWNKIKSYPDLIKVGQKLKISNKTTT